MPISGERRRQGRYSLRLILKDPTINILNMFELKFTIYHRCFEMEAGMARSPFLTLGALFLSSAAGAQVALPMTPIDAAQLSSDVKILSSDEFEGRGPATRAEKRTTDFIIARMKAEGLRPAGEHGGWTQDVPLARYQVKSPVDVSFRGHGRVQRPEESAKWSEQD